jgi:hypothetical protein
MERIERPYVARLPVANPDLLCLYCGEPTKKGRKGEHIVPEAIGGALTLNDRPTNRVVCSKCNSGVLSQLDKELCSRSYLSIVASQEIDAHLWQVWDVDHQANNLLVEARPSWAPDKVLNSLICYPQITFERKGQDIRGDSAEAIRFGREDFSKVLFKAVRESFGRYRSGEKGALNFERIRSGVIHQGYRLAPRIFTPHSISEIAANVRKHSFILRFANEDDLFFVLGSLSNLRNSAKVDRWTHKLGSPYPTIALFFDKGATMRALMKLGLNLIAAYCPKTPVNYESFAQAIRPIRDEAGQMPPGVLLKNGFIHAEDIQCIKAPNNAHSFRLIHTDHKWHIFSSFFGGKVGSYVMVVGPNHEEWLCADIVAPLNSKNWTISTSSILPPMRHRVEWRDSTAIAPSFKLQKTATTERVELVKKKSL